jgi:ABC-type Mn2+/Zn2+ transport system permease subunit
MTTETLLLAVATAVAAGLVGSFAVIRRMALAADAISHIALPGIGIALALHVNPLFGALVALVIGAVLIWGLEEQTGLPTDTIIGVVFSVSLAIGSMLATGEELVEALFGGRGGLTPTEAAIGAVASAAVIAFVLRERHRLVVALVSPDMARTSGINVRRLNLGYILMFALTVALGLRHFGVLLIGALIIIPAATARRLATHLSEMLAMAAVIAALTTIAGFVLAARLDREPGPIVVTLAAVAFALSFVRRRR